MRSQRGVRNFYKFSSTISEAELSVSEFMVFGNRSLNTVRQYIVDLFKTVLTLIANSIMRFRMATGW